MSLSFCPGLITWHNIALIFKNFNYKKPKANSQEPRANNQQPRANSQEPRAN